MSTLSDSPKSALLRAHIRWQLDAGMLPSRAEKQRTYSGYGNDQVCDCCGEFIRTTEVLYEVETPSNLPLTMHLECFNTWAAESRLRSVERLRRLMAESPDCP